MEGINVQEHITSFFGHNRTTLYKHYTSSILIDSNSAKSGKGVAERVRLKSQVLRMQEIVVPYRVLQTL
jgi:hypothetical protein